MSARSTGRKEQPTRIFISATTCDRDAERELLASVVFPQLREQRAPMEPQVHDADAGKTSDDEQGEAEAGPPARMSADAGESVHPENGRSERYVVLIPDERQGRVPEPRRGRANAGHDFVRALFTD